MDTNKYDAVGYVGGVFLCLILVPQLYKVIKLKQTDQISSIFIILAIMTSILFLVYGFLINSIPLIVSNIITALQNSALLILKYKYDNI